MGPGAVTVRVLVGPRGELADVGAGCIAGNSEVHVDATRAALRPYVSARRRAFLGKWVLERIVGLGATRPGLMRRFTHRLRSRTHVADLWVGAAGDTVPVRALFAPRHLLAFL